MKRMRILYLLTTADLVGGTEQAVIHQASALARRGHEVEILSVYRDHDRPHFRVDPKVRVEYAIDRRVDQLRLHPHVADRVRHPEQLHDEPSVLSPPSWDWQFTALCDRVLAMLLTNSPSEIVVAPTPPLTAYATQYCLDSVIVQQEHRATPHRSQSAFERIQAFAGRVDALVSLTDRSTDWLRSSIHGRLPLLLTIPNMNPDGFWPQSSCRAPIVVSAGRLNAGKRFDHLVEAFSLVADDFPEWSLRIFGEGPHGRRLQYQILDLGMSDRVHILPFVSDLRLELAKGSIAALSSKFEGLPLVGLEATATGVPFVSYDIPTGPAEIIEDGVNGFLVRPGDTYMFAKRLARLMGDDGLRRRMGISARESSARYSEQIVTDQWEGLFERLLGERASGNGSPMTGINQRVASDAAEVVTPVLPSVTAERTRERVLAAFREHQVPWAPIPGYGSTSIIAVRDSDLGRVSRALADIRDEMVVWGTDGRGQNQDRWTTGADGVVATVASASSSVFGLMVDASVDAAQVSDPASFVELEVWRSTTQGTFRCPRHNRAASEVEPSWFRVRNDADSSAKLGAELPLWSDISFPIDAVFMWVNSNDPNWQLKRQQHDGGAANYHAEAVDSSRFTDRQELRYSLRAIHAFAPWVRRIHLVTDDQKPDWLQLPDDRLRIVDHREIFPDVTALPTFNSHAIESCLHRIPGLAEHYLVMNDDVMLARGLTPDHFFTSAGQARFFLSPVKINDLPDPLPHIRAAQNNRALLNTKFGRSVTQCFLHTPHPHRKSVVEQAEDDFGDAFAATRFSRFRHMRDISVCSGLTQYYGYFTGSYVPGSLRYSYLQLNAPKMRKMMAQIMDDQSLDVFAIGENSGAAELAETSDLLTDLLETRLPWPSPYEVSVRGQNS